jgi:hypothetical protein
MAWPVTNFHRVQFNDGSGYSELVAIHLAIKQRADASGHSLASGDYASAWDTTRKIWLGDPTTKSGGDGRTYLKDVLQKFYNDIASLVAGSADTSWLIDPDVDDELWTFSDLVDDVDMGPFADLLTKPANHLPFLWLHEALDRLIYIRWRRNIVTIPGDNDHHYSSLSPAVGVSLQDSWDNRMANTDTVARTETLSTMGGRIWQVELQTFPAATKAEIFERGTADQRMDHSSRGNIGTILRGKLTFYVRNFSTISLSVGTATTNTSLASNTDGGYITLDANASEFSLTTVKAPNITIQTAEPSDVPFNSSLRRAGVELGFTAHGDAYIDISPSLTDQA